MQQLNTGNQVGLLLLAIDPKARAETLGQLRAASEGREARACPWAQQILPSDRLSPPGLWVLERRIDELVRSGISVRERRWRARKRKFVILIVLIAASSSTLFYERKALETDLLMSHYFRGQTKDFGERLTTLTRLATERYDLPYKSYSSAVGSIIRFANTCMALTKEQYAKNQPTLSFIATSTYTDRLENLGFKDCFHFFNGEVRTFTKNGADLTLYWNLTKAQWNGYDTPWQNVKFRIEVYLETFDKMNIGARASGPDHHILSADLVAE